ncbi:MAG: hypothetical protein ACR2F6_08055 [Mycobacteriales bacterium]
MFSTKLARLVAVGATGLTLTLSAAACGDSGAPSESKIADAIQKSDKSISDSQAKCLAKVARKYFKGSALKDAVKGNKDAFNSNNPGDVLKSKGDLKKVTEEFGKCQSSK